MNSMRSRFCVVLAFAVGSVLVLARANSAAACTYAVISYHEEEPGYFGCNIGGPGLPVTRIVRTRYYCDTGAFAYAATAELVCHNPNIPESVAATFAAFPAGIVYWDPFGAGDQYECDNPTCNASTPENRCDGNESVPAGLIDPGCNNDENKCSESDKDPFPVRFSSGRVESKPITMFAVETPGDIFFGYRLQYNSANTRIGTSARNWSYTPGVMTLEPAPTIHNFDEDNHFVGRGWLDNFQDRLVFPATGTNLPPSSWVSDHATVTFGAGSSFSGRYEFIDRGAAVPAGQGRYVIRTRDVRV